MLREYTNKLYDLLNEERISPETVIDMCMNWMSEQDVKEMCHANYLFIDEEEE